MTIKKTRTTLEKRRLALEGGIGVLLAENRELSFLLQRQLESINKADLK